MGPAAESHFGSPWRAEEIGHQWKVSAFHLYEQEGRTSGSDHATMDLRRLQMRGDRRLDDCQLTVGSKLVDKITEV